MKSTRIQALVLAAAVALGYGGAAAWTAMAEPSLPVVGDWGDGDGLTRYVVTAAAGTAPADLLTGLEAVDGVVSAQALSDGRALVATDGLAPQQLTALPGVAAAEFDTTVEVAGALTDPFVPQYGWHLDNTGRNAYQQAGAKPDADTDAPDGWDTTTGEGMVVAVIDTGYDSDHPDMAGALWTNPAQPCGTADTDGNGLRGDCHGWNWYAGSADIDNGSYGSHGASVAGTVGARANNGQGLAGVAPGVTIMPLVIGGGQNVSVTAGAEAIRYAVDHGADVINASWGGAFSGPALDVLRSAMAYAAAHDVLFVTAAGNDSGNRDTSPVYPASLTEWNVITVGSSTAADTVSDFSGYGATSVDLFAPGTLIASISNTGGYALSSGTSLASPMVAAAVALYKAAMPTATAAQLRAALLADVDPVPAFAGRSVTGGRLSLGHLTSDPSQTVQYAFSSMTARAGTVTPAVGITDVVGAGDYSVELGLGMEFEGEIWALADKPVTLDGTTLPTDDAGTAVFDLGAHPDLDGIGLSPSMALGDGRYVLTVQLYRDGAAVGRTSAAPLLVGSAVPTPGSPGGGTTPGGTTPGGSTPGSSSPGGTTPGGTTPGGGSAPGGTTPGGTTPGGTAPGGTAPGGTTPGGTTPGGTAPGGTTPGSSNPGGSGPGTTAPTTPPPPSTPSPGSTAPSTPGGTAPSTPGTANPGTPSTPGTTTPSTPSTPGGGSPSPAAPGNGTTTYPSVGEFRITSISPNTVDAAGGTLVTITGTALPAGARVRVGASAAATVVSASSTQVVFRAPARVAGGYDVTVFAPDGRSTVLSSALTYVGGGTAPGGTTPGGGTPGGSTPGGTSPGGTAPGGTTPGGTTPGGSTPGGTTPGGSSPGGGAGATPTAPVERTGPAGERLVRSARFAALGSIWSLTCTSSCTGRLI
jgi:subtilisin family serine protease